MRFDRGQWSIIAAAALVFALVFGVRQSQALFISPLNSATGLGIASISLAFAVAQLMWGITQPFAGAMADRYGSGRVIALGGVLVTLGTVLTPHAHSTWMLILLIGVVAAGGAGMAGLGVLMSAVGRAVPPQQRGLASGIVNAGGSFGQFAVVPVAQLLTGVLGWVGALSAVGAMALATAPLAWLLRGRPEAAPAGQRAAPEKSMRAAVRDAMRDPSFIYLTTGFFVCGFHVAFIATHLPGVVASCQLPPEVAAWSLSLIGLFNIAGSFTARWAIGRWRMKSVLSLPYAARGLAGIAFLTAPQTTRTFLVSPRLRRERRRHAAPPRGAGPAGNRGVRRARSRARRLADRGVDRRYAFRRPPRHRCARRAGPRVSARDAAADDVGGRDGWRSVLRRGPRARRRPCGGRAPPGGPRCGHRARRRARVHAAARRLRQLALRRPRRY